MKKSKNIKVIKSTDLSNKDKQKSNGEGNYRTNEIIKLLKKKVFDIVIFDFKLKIEDSLMLLKRLKFSDIKSKMIIFTNYGKNSDSLLITKKDKPFLLIIEKIPKSFVQKIKSSADNSSFKKFKKELPFMI